MKKEDFKPLRIRAYMQTGIISDQFLPLDAVLYAQMVREKLGERTVSAPGDTLIKKGLNINLPILKKLTKSDAWFYACSFAQWTEKVVEDQAHYSKRFSLQRSDMIDFGKRKAKVDNQRGQYKGYHIKVYYRHAEFVDWYCLGIKEELERLLPFCTHLGKKTAQGWGAVLRWEVVDWPEDWSQRGPGKKLMRAVPIYGKGFVYGVRPSYWLDRHQFPCLMPFG